MACKSKGWSRQKFIDLFAEAGFALSDRTLTRWLQGLKQGDEDDSAEETRGRKSKLSEDDKRVLAGYVFDRQCRNEKTTLLDVRNICSEFLNVEVSTTLASNLMAELGFASRKMQTKTGGYKIDVDGSIDMAFGWLKMHHRELRGSKVYSIDYIFSGHRTDSHNSFVVRGGAASNYSGQLSSYTACGVTMVCSDGSYVPTVLYTANPVFNRERNPTQRRQEILARIDALFVTNKIDPSRIIYVGSEDGKKKKSVVPASADLVERFLDQYEIDFDSIILSDGGHEFKKLGGLGFRRHICYPAAVHQWLSPNDNRLHGAAKKIWRESGIDYSDDALALIKLLRSLDKVTGHVATWFNKNLQLDRPAPQVEAVADLIRGRNAEVDGFYDECRWKYRMVAGLDPRGDNVDEKEDGLNGAYWHKK